ncbi:PepSY domain-containing protein [Paenibacillus sp. F411]|uniref:PepSY-associated TM helix domain-containing protein n=1 Tax=Paenibacillus sp. F411 TaxID=2820239 RepID=UPI0032645B84
MKRMEYNTPPSSSSPASKTVASSAAKRTPYLYQAVWRWHFYAGILIAPFLVILAFSGAVYLFKPQIEGYLYRDLLQIQQPASPRLSADELLDYVKREYPGTAITSFTFSDDSKAAVKMSAIRSGTMSTMYANPYTAEITGILDNDKTFTSYFKKLHSQLLIGGTWANRLVELAACWAVILVITGLYLWWPRSKSAVWGTLLPRLSKPGSRRFWRDLHAVPAFWLSICMLILIATGLPWSGVLGGQISKLANATHTSYPPYAFSFMGKPESVTVTKEIAEHVPWATENLPVPASAAGRYLPLALQEVRDIADKQRIELPYTISLPQGETGVYTISSAHTRPVHNATLHIDQYSGAVLTDVRFADYGILGKAITLGIALHEGRLFGWVNQLLGLITCIGIVLIAVSSYVMWRKRKPQGRLGAPGRPEDRRTTRVLLLIMMLLGLLMPLVGLSLIIVLLLDLLIIRRIPSLKHWFSA